ncbi:MAG: phage terminase large subunit family protein, partial [Gammaproteobacteria bacterium]|nr:phage terminase large subunit family protein [Gammaproteobacteria bacterium]
GRKTNKKTGDTSTRKDFPGGFLIAIGARSPGKMRQFSVKVALFDELDAFPDRLGGKSGKEGDPVQLAKTRTNAFEATRKILYLSTPLITQTSKILPLYEQGDQRRYFVPCIHCGVMQTLEWRILLEDGTRAGIVFDLDDAGNLVRDSVGYKCPHCRGVMRNHDKEIIMRLDKAEWRPTATSVRPDYRSYHISALYSPVGMRTWTAIVDDWLKAWDEVNDRVKDQELLKTHYNLDRGLPYEERGEAPKFEKIIGKRRAIYSQGEIPNVAAVRETGKHIALLTMAGDVHADRIDVEVLGWCEGGRSYSIEWLSLVGDTTDLDGPAWTAMAEMIETQVWLADDGKSYQPIMTFIDSQYRTDEVLTFCSEYNDQVMAIRGDHLPMRGARRREFSEFTSKSGTSGLQVTVTLYKDRLAGWLRREWEGEGIQPVGYPNYPRDYEDEYFRQYEREKKVKEINRSIGREVHKWVRTGDNHAFDCRVYNMAALDWIVYTTCLYAWGYDGIDYRAFWDGVYSDNMLNSWAD